MCTLNNPSALWRRKCICYGAVLLIFHWSTLTENPMGKIWDFWDKNLLQSSGILSKTVFSKNHELDVKYPGWSVHGEVKRGRCVLLFSRARLVAQSTVREFMLWGGWGEWGRKDSVLMTSWWCLSSILSALFGTVSFPWIQTCSFNKKKEGKRVSHR